MLTSPPFAERLETAPRPPETSADDVTALRRAIFGKLTYAVGQTPDHASDRDWFVAAALATRDQIVNRWVESNRVMRAEGRKLVYYLSLEFLIGRLLFDVWTNLGMVDQFRTALAELGVDAERIRAAEPDAALGNGGLGRLAACFMDSMASLAIPAYGYGIRYDHGLFRQVIKDGWQQEYPETWLSYGNPWEFERPELVYDVHFGGSVEQIPAAGGMPRHRWHPGETVEAIAFDTPIVGWRGRQVNVLRLWSARAVDPLRLDAFNSGDHLAALTEQVRAEAISKVLYPSDATPAGQELRLRQEYFFVSASLQDLVRRHMHTYGDIRSLAAKAAIQLNDTHPAISVAELMRILVDQRGLGWDDAWDITVRTLAYTNHTLLPEALEAWPLTLFERLLPRHMQIIYHINALHLDRVTERFPGEEDYLRAVSLIDEHGGRHVRMGHLAFIGSHRINGVSALHSDLMKKTVFRDLDRLYPDRIVNRTNGITFRRWLHQANPGLTGLLVETCGEAVRDDPSEIAGFSGFADDPAIRERLAAIKRANKVALARIIGESTGIAVDPGAMFDVQIKRIHEYKRQLLNLLEIIALYDEIRANPTAGWVPRVKIFAGKAAASYAQAKLIIKLANDVARAINHDPTVRGLLRVVFMPNYNVSLAEAIIPAADLSEQISTAGMEASGTGNMKLALNGALTIGTLDGANVEIREHVGTEHIFIFGLTAAEAGERRSGYDTEAVIAASPRLTEALATIAAGVFSPGDPGRFMPLVEAVRRHDRFLVAADFEAYYACQRLVDSAWRDQARWMRSSVFNIAGMGWFSSDRAIREYASGIWDVPAVLPSVR